MAKVVAAIALLIFLVYLVEVWWKSKPRRIYEDVQRFKGCRRAVRRS